MIGYVTLGTNNFEAALKFYDVLFSSVGANRLWNHGGMGALAGRACVMPCLSVQWGTGKCWKRGDGRFENDQPKSRRYASRQVPRTWRNRCGPPRPTRRSWFLRGVFPGSKWQQTECLCPSVTAGKDLAVEISRPVDNERRAHRKTPQ